MGGTEVLSARNLARYGLRRGAYDGANRRRFVLFESLGGVDRRHEFDTKRERDRFALDLVAWHDTGAKFTARDKVGSAAR